MTTPPNPNGQLPEIRYHRGLLSGILESWRLRTAASFIKAGDAVLDLACNEGRLNDYLPPNCDYVGIDIGEGALALAKTRHPQREFVRADLTQPLPALGRDFDVIVMLAFLEHVAHPDQVLANAAYHLKTGGKIVITTPAPQGRKIHDFGARIGIFSRDAAEEHETFLDRPSLIRFSRDAGLNLLSYQPFMFGFNQVATIGRSPA